ncbi:MAG: riboflavin synthase [Chloroflexi bacterium]|nr:riboflavin synthase [Chloroflexota bacterium]
MFTGIVQEMGEVLALEGGRLVVRAAGIVQRCRIGDSVAVNGACLTVVARETDSFVVEMVPETLRRTNLGLLRVGDRVDLEGAMATGESLGGHFVQGHVEAAVAILESREEDNSAIYRFSLPAPLSGLVVAKGFVALDGVSLTVVECDSGSFSVALIPHTRHHTVLGQKGPGDLVNLETDVLGRYVEKLLQERLRHLGSQAAPS